MVPSEGGLDSELQALLETLFGQPNADGVDDVNDNDLAIDIYVPSYAQGISGHVDVGDVPVPIFFRPKVEIRARLYYLKTGKTRQVFEIRKQPRLTRGVRDLFSLRSLFGFGGNFTKEDVEQLMIAAAKELADRLAKYA